MFTILKILDSQPSGMDSPLVEWLARFWQLPRGLARSASAPQPDTVPDSYRVADTEFCHFR